MNKNTENAAIAIAAVVLGYAVWARFFSATTIMGRTAVPTLGAKRPGLFQDGAIYSGTAPGAYLSTDDLIYNVVNGNPYGDYASIDDLIGATVYGGNRPSVVKIPGREWW